MGRKSSYTIRHATPDDYPDVTRIFEGPKAIAGTLQLPYPSPEIWRKRLAEPGDGVIMLVACKGGTAIGILGIHTNPSQPRRRHAAMIGVTVRDDHQGRGVGTALMKAALDLSDRWLNLTRLELTVWTDNEPALRLYQRFGFEVEGTLRQHALREGQFIDAFILSRLRPPAAGKQNPS